MLTIQFFFFRTEHQRLLARLNVKRAREKKCVYTGESHKLLPHIENRNTHSQSHTVFVCAYLFECLLLLAVLYRSTKAIRVYNDMNMNCDQRCIVFGWFFVSLSLFLFVYCFVRTGIIGNAKKKISWMCFSMLFSAACTVRSSRAQFLLYCFIRFHVRHQHWVFNRLNSVVRWALSFLYSFLHILRFHRSLALSFARCFM